LLLIGGDTTASSILVLTATVLGGGQPGQIVRRSGAHLGDLVVVTGVLGEAGAGFGILDKLYGADPPPKERWLRPESPLPELSDRLREREFDRPVADDLAEAARRFLRPYPPLATRPLVAAAGATSLIDISDGLASEADWIAQESEVGIVIDAKDVPLGAGTRAWADYRGLDPMDLAWGGGEDYELL